MDVVEYCDMCHHCHILISGDAVCRFTKEDKLIPDKMYEEGIIPKFCPLPKK